MLRVSDPLSMSDEVFRGLAWYGGLSLVKTACMSLTTSTYRRINKAFQNPEDALAHAGGDRKKAAEWFRKADDVERVKRAHRNDIENVVPFIFAGLLYCASKPSSTTALLHFKVFFFSRVLHTIGYLSKVKFVRTWSFVAGHWVNLSMLLQVIHKSWL